MRLFLLDCFGWSFLWILPLLGRVLVSLLAGKGLRGRGSIRIWLGTLIVLCASSAMEAMLRSQGDGVLDSDLFGQALARNLTAAAGKLFSVLILIASALIGLFWLFGRNRKAQLGDEVDVPSSLPLQASVARRTQSHIAPTIRNLPASQALKASAAAPLSTGAKAQPFGNLTRKRDPWPLPNALPRAANPAHTPAGKWPTASRPAEPAKRPARPASEWAPFEALRPTQAMLARSASTPLAEPPRQTLPKPSLATSVISKPRITPIPGSSTKVRISTASDRSQAIPTSLSAAIAAQQPVVATLPQPVPAPEPIHIVMPRLEAVVALPQVPPA